MACSGGVGPAEESVNPTPALTPDCRGPARRSRDGWQGKTRELEQEGKADGEAQGEEPQTHAGGQGRFCLARTGQGMLPVQTKAHASHLQAWERALQLQESSAGGANFNLSPGPEARAPGLVLREQRQQGREHLLSAPLGESTTRPWTWPSPQG